jgi:hypothetical protein
MRVPQGQWVLLIPWDLGILLDPEDLLVQWVLLIPWDLGILLDPEDLLVQWDPLDLSVP